MLCARGLAFLPIAGVLAVHQGALLIEEEGKTVEVHVTALAEKGKLFETDGRSLTLRWGDQVRGFLAVSDTDDMPVNNYWNVTLFNKEVSFDLDLSAVPCSCNAALFFVSMPGHNPDGTIAHGDSPNPYYCDANKIGGVWCWEHDVIESNQYALASTPHVCNAAPGQHTTSCDRVGCQSSTFKADRKSFCPDPSCKIDSSKPFSLRQQFVPDSSFTKLASIRTRLIQGNNTFDFTACHDDAKLEAMTGAFKSNMSMVFQLWGDTWQTMDWLDAATECSGECNPDTTVTTMSNIAIRSLSAEELHADVIVV